MSFCFATFCFGNRYYEQVNRFITDIDSSDFKPTLIVITDNPNEIQKREFVKTFNVGDFNTDYLNYGKTYYDFDFSVKRYSVRAAHSLGFTKIILVDADMRVNYNLFNESNILNSFDHNSIVGPVTYNFSEQVNTNSELGRRLLEYEKSFEFDCDKNTLNFMPEDCVQYISMDNNKLFSFLDTWDKCIEIKNSKPLRNVPAGNIDEMCFASLYNGLTVGNNSNRSLNIIYPEHDKWY
jgi:hypothetical protein